jgi:hypothetical protein
MDQKKDYCGYGDDPSDQRLKCEGSWPLEFLSREGLRLFINATYQRILRRGRKWKARLQGSLYIGWCSVPFLSTLNWQASEKEPPCIGHQVHGGPRRKVCGGHVDELGELPRQRIRKGLS